jgi:RNA polymerase sigma-70 factor (ECF subfamily)
MKGDRKAFESLYLRYLKEVIFQARKLLDRKEDAEDAAQEIVLALYRNIKTLSSPFAFHAYLYRTIYTTCVNRNMQCGGKDLQLEDFEETLADSEATQPEQRFEEREIKAEIRRFVDQLAPKQRLCVYLYYFYDMSYDEIARALNATTNAVGVNLTKARRVMERLLTKGERDKQDGQSVGDVTKNGIALTPFVCDALREGINLEVSEQTVAGVAAACQTLIVAGGATTATAGAAGAATTAAMMPAKGIVGVLLAATVLFGGGMITNYALQHDASAQQVSGNTAQHVVEKPGFTPQAQIIFESDPASPNTTTAYLSTNEGWGEVWYLYDAAGEVLATGTSDRIEGSLNDLAPGSYTIKWILINSDRNRAVATQPFTVT